MPAIVRQGDMSSGCCAPPRGNIQGHAKTLINGKPIHCKGHAWQPHACPKQPPHGAVTVGGSSKSMAGGRPIARVGDSISCGSSCVQGSSDTFAN